MSPKSRFVSWHFLGCKIGEHGVDFCLFEPNKVDALKMKTRFIAESCVPGSRLFGGLNVFNQISWVCKPKGRLRLSWLRCLQLSSTGILSRGNQVLKEKLHVWYLLQMWGAIDKDLNSLFDLIAAKMWEQRSHESHDFCKLRSFLFQCSVWLCLREPLK